MLLTGSAVSVEAAYSLSDGGCMEGRVDIREENKGEIVVLRLKGRLDAISSPAAERIWDAGLRWTTCSSRGRAAST